MQEAEFNAERMKGIEPSCPAWEAGVLPLNYTRNYNAKIYKHPSKWRLIIYTERGDGKVGLTS